MNLLRHTIILALFLLLSACATTPFPPTELVPTTPRTAAEFAGVSWRGGSGSVLFRQSALFEFEGMKVPLAAVMKLNRSSKIARLVGMNDMGVKLYDISVDAVSSQAHFIVPDLARHPGFTDAVAASVRRIFLNPEPAPGDSLELTPKSYLLTRKSSNGDTTRFTFGGADAQLLEKTLRGRSELWRVRYYQYKQHQGQFFPGGIVLEDELARYRLTLWIESVDKIDE